MHRVSPEALSPPQARKPLLPTARAPLLLEPDKCTFRSCQKQREGGRGAVTAKQSPTRKNNSNALPPFLISGCTGSLMLCMGVLQLQRGEANFQMRCPGSSLQWHLWLWMGAQGTRAQQLWCTGLAAPWHVGSFRTRDQTPGSLH